MITIQLNSQNCPGSAVVDRCLQKLDALRLCGQCRPRETRFLDDVEPWLRHAGSITPPAVRHLDRLYDYYLRGLQEGDEPC